MPLTLEDGTGVALANSFVEVTEADAWLLALNETAWAALPVADKERNLILGALYVSNGQIFHYSGSREFYEQGLAWPRVGATYQGGPVIPSGAIPNEVKTAQITAAQAAMHGILPTVVSAEGGGVAGGSDVKSENLVSMAVEYFDPKRSVGAKSTTAAAPLGADALGSLGLPAVVGILAPLLDEDFYAEAAAVEGAAKIAPVVGLSGGSGLPPQFWIGFQDGPAAYLTPPVPPMGVVVGTTSLPGPHVAAALTTGPEAPDLMHPPTVPVVVAVTPAPRRYGPA